MTCNNIILSQPEAGEMATHDIPADVSARLNFSPDAIEALQLSDMGELVISFVDGGQLKLSNFDQLIDNGNLLYLEDGTLIDPSILTAAATSPQALSTIETAAGSASANDAISIEQPDPNTVQEITAQAGQKYVCEFDPSTANVEIIDGKMVMTFADGSQVVINNYSEAVAGDLPAELTVADGTVVEPEELLTEVTEVQEIEEILEVAEAPVEEDPAAEQVANIEPAAGEESVAETLAQIEPAAGEAPGATGNSGYGFNSSPTDVNLNAPDAIGPLGPTALQYGIDLPQQEQLLIQPAAAAAPDDRPFIAPVSSTLDETALGVGSLVATGTINVDYGNDGPGTLEFTGNVTATCDVAGGVLSSGGVPVVITFDAVTNTYTGVAGSTTVFTMVVDPETGDFTYTQDEPFDHADTSNDNEPICLNFEFVAQDADGDRTLSNISINVLDDAPVVTSQIEKTVDETDAVNGKLITTGQFFTDPGEDVDATYAGTGDFAVMGSSSAGTSLSSNGVAVDVTFDSATNTYTGMAGTEVVFTMVIDPVTGAFTYEQCAPFDHADGTDPNDMITLEFGASVTDFDGDTKTGTLTVNVLDDAPEIEDAYNTVDETDLGPVVVTGNVAHQFGEDGPAAVDSFDATGDFDSSGSQLNGQLSHNGVPVVVTFDAVTSTYTGTAGGVTVFTMEIESNGDYTFELLETLDHADPNDPNDIIHLEFGVSVTDFDGDTAEGTIIIDVKDDVPVIGDTAGDVDESDLDNGPLVYTDTVVTNQPPGTTTVEPNGTTNPSVPLETCGVPIVISQTTNGYIGVANGVTVFTLTVAPVTGQYTYTQFEPIDHPDSTDPNDVISIDFGITVESLDGTEVDSVITINVADDGPAAVQDINGAEEGQTITGDVVANDVLSQDDDNTVTNVNFNGTDYPIPANGSETIVGDFGILIINSDGTYEYTANSDDPDGVDTFTYTLTDCDGDMDTATLSITVTPDGQPVAVSQTLAVDETNLTPGPMIFNGDLNVDFGIDGAGTVAPNGQFTAGGSLLGGQLTSGGVPVIVTSNGNTYTGMAGTITVFTVTINNDGTYAFQLFDHIDHADNTDPNDVITMEFGVTATDADGDVANGTFTINVHDDAPVAYDDGETDVVESQSVSGNVLTGVGGPGATADELSEDRPTDVVMIGLSDATGAIIPGSEVAVPTSGTATITGQFGVLVIASDGSYTYTANSNNPTGIDSFTYVIEDFDGDQDTAEISFNVSPENDVPIVVQPDPLTVDDTDLENGPNVVTGTVNVDYQNDGPGEVNPDGIFTSSVANLTSCGEDIVVTLNGNTYTGVANGVTVFTMEILENGNYTFTQFEAIDHPNTLNPNDSITLNFGATASDSDNDSTATTIQINVLDDGPEIGEIFHPVYEEVLENGTLVANGTVPNDFGEDGAGSITLNGLFEAKFQMNGANVQLQSGGQDITVSASGNVYTGTLPGGQVAFTLTVDPATGDYTYEQFAPIDHPDNTDPDDVIWLKFYVDITDCDGDMDTGIIIIDVHDDGPLAVNDDHATEEGQTITGNVIDNDDVGVDVEGCVLEVTFNGTTTPVPETGTINVVGDYGVLTIAADGTYSYAATAEGSDVFTYTLKDADGDTSEADLSIVVAPDPAPVGISGTGSTDDTVVGDSGQDTEIGTINVNYQGDGPGTTTGNGSFNVGPNNLVNGVLSHNGTPINVTFNPTTNVYTGAAGALTIFTMTINPDGTYEFTQFEAIDHGDKSDTNEAITLDFGVTATDADGDTGDGIVTITVYDDAPVANDIRITQADFAGGDLFTGSVLSNDDLGGDGAGSPVIILNAGVYVTPHGTLTLNQDGSYSFDLNRNNTTNHNYELPYGIQDADGDVSYAVLRFSVTPLVLDLDGDGVELTSTQDGVMFDYDNDGELEQTAWVSADDGFLVQDRNGDGVINDRSEMFGDMFGHADGFAHLASLDTNNDGVINNQDAEWSDLQVWQDLNQDGISDENELFGLDEIGIESINVANTTEVDQEIGDNFISDTSTYTTTDGETNEIADVHFDYEDDAIDMTQYLVEQGDELMLAAIGEAAETQEVFATETGMTAEDVFFVDQAGSVDEAIQEFVAQNGDETNAISDGEQAGLASEAQLADLQSAGLLDDLNENTSVI